MFHVALSDRVDNQIRNPIPTSIVAFLKASLVPFTNEIETRIEIERKSGQKTHPDYLEMFCFVF